ncbi:hypothetical protein [Stutzerimonas azotifigens]|uniref:hypothetical protein n=1 Tax=Stutzerimonas azotifigens TaxID=291995 RepID=UPI0004049E22|nr:hypothetical protein [Stutzerimonas azotifigens]
MIDYLAAFPVPAHLLPERLRLLLQPIGTDPALRVEVSCFTEDAPSEPKREAVFMLMAVVPGDSHSAVPILSSEQGQVAYSTPILREKGSERGFSPSVSGYDYIVASWGDGSFYTYHLAEKVWMTLGLTPRCFGNEQQRLVYDDLGLPEFGVAEGEISAQYYFTASRQIQWFMSNEYLRKYLWLRGGRGVRQLYYKVMLQDVPELREWMNGRQFVELGASGGWLEGDIREERDGFLLQVWATVEAISCELSPEQSAEGLHWPGIKNAVTRVSANAILNEDSIYLDDRFLERYEQSSFYDSTPVNLYGFWHCSPSYLGQWAFSGCMRVGRNLIRVPLRELYKGTPDREILHAHAHALDPHIVAQHDMSEEHIVSKVDRLLAQLLALGESLSELAGALGIERSANDLIGFTRSVVKDDGWLHYPQLEKLAQVAPIAMTQQAFLARCKSIHELWQKLPNGFLKQILQMAGVPRVKISNRASLRLLQTLLNILQRLDNDEEAVDAFKSDQVPEHWDDRNSGLAMLFVANDFRIADAHDSVGESLQRLQDQGFDIASLHQGYGRALDFVLDGVINSFDAINAPLKRILSRA